MCGVVEPMEFMPYAELFDDLTEKYQVISYKEYRHTSSVTMESDNSFGAS
jgi:hypothetical protein|eukprot:evm.model.NODE_46972_length_7241_cov_15.990747.1